MMRLYLSFIFQIKKLNKKMAIFETKMFAEMKSNAGGKVQQNQHCNGVTNQFVIQV